MAHRARATPHPGYVSDYEKFMGQFLDEHPAVIKNQRDGWHIFWDRNIDPEDYKIAYRDSVPVKAYPYF